MTKKILTAIVLLSLILIVAGCNQTSANPTASSRASTIINTVKLAEKWQMNQMRLEIESGSQLQLLLKLNYGDQADGYFYLEKGQTVGFSISGTSLMYTSQSPQPYGPVTSDRFTFTASQAQGTTYTLTFQNSTGSPVTVFLEMIYPSTGSLYTPVDVK